MKSGPARWICLLFVLSLAAGACTKKEPKGVDIPPAQLVPPSANIVFGVNIGAVQDTMVAKLLWPQAAADPDIRKVSAAFKRCHSSTADLKILLAVDAKTEDTMGVLTGAGVGQEKLLQCIERAAASAEGQRIDEVMVLDRGNVRVAPQQDGGFAVLLNKNALAFVPDRWSKSFLETVNDYKPTPGAAKTGPALPAFEKGVDAWFQVTLSESDRTDLGDVPGAGSLQVILVRTDLQTGLSAKAELTFADKENATLFASSIKSLLAETKAGLSEAPKLVAVIDEVKIAPDPKDAKRLTIEAAVSNENLPAVMAQAMSVAQ